MKDNLQKYFIAILPGNDVSSEARRLQEEFHNQHNARAALRSPPHITLHMPFNWKERKEGELVSSLNGFCSVLEPFSAKIEGFGAFPPKVIYMSVITSGELMECHKKLARFCRMELGLFNAVYRDEPYHPHLTIAFRDLKKPAFLEAWEIYKHKAFSATFDVNEISLLKHDGKEWKAFQSFALRNS